MGLDIYVIRQKTYKERKFTFGEEEEILYARKCWSLVNYFRSKPDVKEIEEDIYLIPKKAWLDFRDSVSRYNVKQLRNIISSYRNSLDYTSYNILIDVTEEILEYQNTIYQLGVD